ncbi:MAG: hypothetical protein HZB29_01540 [Nitrospinae bacterium]|nr:hypothetical protein [Nitrospinota bacterium]
MKDCNYYSAFIAVSEDCPAAAGHIPPQKGKERTIPELQYRMLANSPYKYTQEDVLFEIHAIRNNIPKGKKSAERLKYFSKGQACLRCSPLGKRYGWGIHFDTEGKAAIYGAQTAEYKRFAKDKSLKQMKAMASGKR